jgi:hypothetical protein
MWEGLRSGKSEISRGGRIVGNYTDLDINKTDGNNYKIVINMDGTVKFHTTSKLVDVDYNIIGEKIILEFDVSACRIENLEEKTKIVQPITVNLPEITKEKTDEIVRRIAEELKEKVKTGNSRDFIE